MILKIQRQFHITFIQQSCSGLGAKKYAPMEHFTVPQMRMYLSPAAVLYDPAP